MPPACRCRNRSARRTSTPSRPNTSRRTRATGRSSGGSRATSAGMRWPWWSTPTGCTADSAAISPPTPRRRRCTRWRSTISSAAATADRPGDMVYFQGHASPGIYARAFLEGRLSEQHLHNFRQELAEGGGLSSYPHPVPDAGVLAVPHRLDGPRPAHVDLPGAVQPLPEGARLHERRGTEGLGVRRRRRNGRAGNARLAHARLARESRQSDLGGQLQPAAARRPGARQRQDHPGAGSGVPRRRLECHQGDLGLGLGSAACRGQERAAAQADGGSGGRRLPEVLGRAGQLHAQAFLRQVSRAAASW